MPTPRGYAGVIGPYTRQRPCSHGRECAGVGDQDGGRPVAAPAAFKALVSPAPAPRLTISQWMVCHCSRLPVMRSVIFTKLVTAGTGSLSWLKDDAGCLCARQATPSESAVALIA